VNPQSRQPAVIYPKQTICRELNFGAKEARSHSLASNFDPFFGRVQYREPILFVREEDKKAHVTPYSSQATFATGLSNVKKTHTQPERARARARQYFYKLLFNGNTHARAH
jgi:hypothetical protein